MNYFRNLFLWPLCSCRLSILGFFGKRRRAACNQELTGHHKKINNANIFDMSLWILTWRYIFSMVIWHLPFRWTLSSNQRQQIQYIINLFTINWSNRYYSNSTFLINNFFEKSTGVFYSLEELITIWCNNNVRKVHEVINLGDEDEELALGFVVWIAAGFESSENFLKIRINFINVAECR